MGHTRYITRAGCQVIQGTFLLSATRDRTEYEDGTAKVCRAVQLAPGKQYILVLISPSTPGKDLIEMLP